MLNKIDKTLKITQILLNTPKSSEYSICVSNLLLFNTKVVPRNKLHVKYSFLSVRHANMKPTRKIMLIIVLCWLNVVGAMLKSSERAG